MQVGDGQYSTGHDCENGIDDRHFEVADQFVDAEAEHEHEDHVAGEVHDSPVQQRVGQQLINMELAVVCRLLGQQLIDHLLFVVG